MAFVLAAFALFAGAGAFAQSPTQDPAKEALPAKVAIYTATGGTTVALPLMGALKKGWPGTEVELIEWKNLDDLKGLALSGKGDFWLGHLESLALAAGRGAPAVLVSVTAWKKFYFVSGKLEFEPGSAPVRPKDLEALSAYLKKKKLTLATAPQNSPAQGIVDKLGALGGPSFELEGLPPQQVLLELATGRRPCALLPEPMATVALSKNPDLGILANLEEEYAKMTKGLPRLPQAGVAVNAAFAAKHPGLVRELATLMRESAEEMKNMSPAEIVSLLPPSVAENLGRENLENSLKRDPIMAVSAADAFGEIEAFLCVATPELCRDGKLDKALDGFVHGAR
ncbi:MAG: hypothetical protein LBF41_04625 [Deltaproteobacteria bacterium]|jgi:NitT/TauT family transport system substrate-binding protein|nr:hypothetical protein [Deltaproteobacteria bacterium]